MKPLHLQLLVLGYVLGAAPQFITASNLADFSEVRSASMGGGAVAIAALLKWVLSGNKADKEEL